MDERGIQAMRWTLVAVFTCLAWGLEHDGITAGEVTGLFVVGAVFLVVIVSAGWVKAAGHARGGEIPAAEDDPDLEWP